MIDARFLDILYLISLTKFLNLNTSMKIITFNVLSKCLSFLCKYTCIIYKDDEFDNILEIIDRL